MKDNYFLYASLIGLAMSSFYVFFLFLYRIFPRKKCKIISKDLKKLEIGNSVRINFYLIYRLDDKEKMECFTISGYKGDADKLENELNEIKEYYSNKEYVRYYYTPIIQSLGMIEKPQSDPTRYFWLLLFLIFCVVVFVSF